MNRLLKFKRIDTLEPFKRNTSPKFARLLLLLPWWNSCQVRSSLITNSRLPKAGNGKPTSLPNLTARIASISAAVSYETLKSKPEKPLRRRTRRWRVRWRRPRTWHAEPRRSMSRPRGGGKKLSETSWRHGRGNGMHERRRPRLPLAKSARTIPLTTPWSAVTWSATAALSRSLLGLRLGMSAPIAAEDLSMTDTEYSSLELYVFCPMNFYKLCNDVYAYLQIQIFKNN